MNCSRCKWNINNACLFFKNNIPDLFKFPFGCNLKYQEAKKLSSLTNDEYEKYFKYLNHRRKFYFYK